MTASFNLIDERWIPCVRLDGTRVELGLRETLVQADNLQEILGDSPLVVTALYRLLLVVLHRVFGPKDRASWVQLWEAKVFPMDRLDEYLNEWKKKRRFDLFDDEHPFYQIADESKLGEWDNLNKMIHHVASGVTATLFDHHLDTKQEGVVCTPAEAARYLVTVQSFALGYQKFTDAPCAKGAVFFVRGESLFETLMLNLVRYPDEEVMPSDKDDVPAWEMGDPFKGNRALPKGYLDYLTWQNRRIKLFRDADSGLVSQVAWSPGLRLKDEVLDPMQHHRKSKEKGWQVLQFSNSKALWRDSATLLQLSNTEDHTLKALEWLARLNRLSATILSPMYRLMALGMGKDRAKIEFFRAELTPLPLKLLDDEKMVSELSEALQSAESVGRLLQTNFASTASAVFMLARLITRPNTSTDNLRRVPSSEEEKKSIANLANSWGVERYYWSGLELHFHRLVKDLPNDSEKALAEWRTQVRRAARFAFERAEEYAGQDLRAQRAIVKAREQFDRGLNDYVPYQTKGGNV